MQCNRIVFTALLFAFVARVPRAATPAVAPSEKLVHGDFQPAIVTGRLHGTPFHLAPWRVLDAPGGTCTWYHLPPPNQLAVAVGGGTAIEQTIRIPGELPGNKEFGGLLTVKILGARTGRSEAGYRLDFVDPATNASVAHAVGKTRLLPPPVIPNATWKVTADSVLSDHHAPFNAVDHNPDTLWYTKFGKDAPPHPHSLVIDLGKVRRIRGLLYEPRRTGTLGIVKAYAVFLGNNGKDWGKPVAEGVFDYGDSPNTLQTVSFKREYLVRYVKFETRAEIAGHKRASAAEIRPIFADAAPADATAESSDKTVPGEEACLALTVSALRKYAGKDLLIRITGTSATAVVVDSAAWRTYPLGRKFNINNWGKYGSKGVYEVDVAPLGIEAISYPDSVFLPIMNVRDGSPALRAGLKIGDIISGVSGAALPPAVNRPKKEWVTQSHAAVIGRAIAAAQERGADGVDFEVLHNGVRDIVHVLLPPECRKPFSPTFPFGDSQVTAMHRDILNQIVSKQEENGSWHNGGNDYMQTALAGLALLGTHDPKYAPNIKRAADYFLKRYKYPSDLVYLDYWCVSYAGWFLCEYYLATGDDRVIPWLKRMLDWLPETTHMSWWDYPVWGHGSGGLPYGGKSLISPTIHLYLFGSLARLCGVPGRNWDITRIHLFRSWSDPAEGGHGGIGYGPQLKDVGQAWSRTGLTGLALKMRGERPDMVEAIAKFMDEHDYLLFNSHGYGTAGAFLGLVSLSQLDPAAFRRIMPEWRWLFALSWEPGFGMRYSSDHMGYAIRGDGYMTHFCGFFLTVVNHGLFLTGASERNWLDVSRLPTPLTEVEIKRNRVGEIALECRLAGPRIRYTLDGSDPGQTAKFYDNPIPLPDGGIVTACAVGKGGKIGPVVRKSFGTSRRDWTVESSNKSRIDPQQRWAKLAIDGDPQTWWHTDRSGRAIPPYWLALHFGKPLAISGITVLPRQDDTRATDIKDYAVFVSTDGKNWGKPVIEGVLPKGRKRHRILFGRVVRAPHLKLEVYSTHGNWSFVCAAEIDVIQPQPEISLDPATGTKVVIASPGPGFSIRYTMNGTIPDMKSPVYRTPLSLSGRPVVIARCATEDGRLGRPVLFRPPEVRFFDVHYACYDGAPWGGLPDFSKLKPVKQGKTSSITLDVSPKRDAFGLVFTGKVRTGTPGKFKFYTVSDDGTRLFIDGKLVVDNDGQHAAVRKEGVLSLDTAPHTFRLEYFDAGGADHLEVGAIRE